MNQDELRKQTRAHYEEFPFDFLTAEDVRNIVSLQPVSFLRYPMLTQTGGKSICDRLQAMLGNAIHGAARSGPSGSRHQPRHPSSGTTKRPACRLLQLPLQNGFFDAVVSDGVIHHTPDAYRSFCENARILRPGGMMYVGVYRRRRYYYYVYNYLGRPIPGWKSVHGARP